MTKDLLVNMGFDPSCLDAINDALAGKPFSDLGIVDVVARHCTTLEQLDSLNFVSDDPKQIRITEGTLDYIRFRHFGVETKQEEE